MKRLAFATLAFLVILPGLASARPRVALIKFEGDTNGEVQDVVSETLDGDATLVGAKEVNRTVDKLGLGDDMSEKDLKKLATELEADALVQGKIGKKGDNRVAHFKLFVHGKKKGFSVEFSNLKSEKLKTTLHKKLLEKIGAGSDDDSAKKKDDEDAPKKAAQGDDDEDPVGGKKATKADKKKKKKHGDDDDTAKKKGDDDDAMAKKSDDDDSAKKKSSDDDDTAKKKSDDDTKQASDDEDQPKKKKHKDDDGDDDDKPRKGKKRTASADDDDNELHASADTDRPGKNPLHAANRDAVRVDVGISVTTRTLKFASRSFEQAPNGYKNSPVPGARVEGELYPFAFQNPKSAAAGLGIAGSYDKTLALSLQSTKQPGTKFPVDEHNYSIGIRYRLAFGSKDTSPTLTLGASYGGRAFIVNRTALMDGNTIDLPDTNYVGFMPGLEIRIPILPTAALFVGGRAILMKSTGDIQSNTQYGQAKVSAGEGEAGVDIILGNRFAIRLSGQYTQIGFAFTGTGMMTNNRDGDPTTKDVGGATDRYIGGAATLAVFY